MYYIIVDTIDSRMYYKGVKDFQGREYHSYSYNKEDALKIKEKDKAERIAENINGKVKEIKK